MLLYDSNNRSQRPLVSKSIHLKSLAAFLTGVSGGEKNQGQDQSHPGNPCNPTPPPQIGIFFTHRIIPPRCKTKAFSLDQLPSECTTPVETTPCLSGLTILYFLIFAKHYIDTLMHFITYTDQPKH